MAVFQRGLRRHFEFMYGGGKIRRACGKNCHSKMRAQQIEREARARAMNGDMPMSPRSIPILREAAQSFLTEREEAFAAGNLAANTLRHYRNAWNSWLAPTSLAAMRVNRITEEHIAGIQFPGGAFTTQNARQCLGAILEWCRRHRFIVAVPRLQGHRLEGRKIRITAEIESALRAHMERDVNDIFTVMLDAVMRNSEVMAMRWEHVDWEREEYFVAGGKTDAARRRVPISQRMRDMLVGRQAQASSEWIFPSRIHRVGHRVTIAKQFRAARVAAGIDPKIKLYCARHTGASELSEMGVDLLTLRTILGHEDISTTNKYLHGDTRLAKVAINRRNLDRSGLRVVQKKA